MDTAPKADSPSTGFVEALGFFDSTAIVAGSMIGSGVFIVSADVARHVGSSGWLLLAWVVAGFLTVSAALAYGELAGMMPKAGGQYVYLREAYSPLWGFLFGWTMFLVIQTGTIAAVAVGFARYLGVLIPWISPTSWIVPPLHLSRGYAVSLSTQQVIAILMVIFLTWINTHGVQLGKRIQNVFTSAKALSLILLIGVGLFVGYNAEAVSANFSEPWSSSATSSLFGFLAIFCLAQVGPLFSSDAWNNVTFIAGEIRNPKRNIPLSLFTGTAIVTGLYLLANVAYLVTLPLSAIQQAPDDRVATVALQHIFGDIGATIMAIAIVISTFGCNNGLVLAGARVYYAMAKDKLFFQSAGRLNRHHVPAGGLLLQGIWTCLLLLPRTRIRGADGVETYGNLYSSLLDYVIFAVLIFYVLTVISVFVLRKKKPEVERPYRAFGYPWVPAGYVLLASTIVLALLAYKTQTAWPGLVVVLSGIPAYFVWKWRAQPAS